MGGAEEGGDERVDGGGGYQGESHEGMVRGDTGGMCVCVCACGGGMNRVRLI